MVLNKIFNQLGAQNEIRLKQQNDDGTNRIIIEGSDGNNKAEVYHDGTDIIVNPLTGDLNLNSKNLSNIGALTTDQAIIGSNEYDIVEDGNGDLVIRDDQGNDIFIWDKSAGQWDFKSQTIANVGSFSTEGADITNETLVYAETDGTVSIGSADSWTSPSFGTENTDERNEWDAANDQFSPDVSGHYHVYAFATFSGTGMSDQDLLQSRLRDVTGGNTVQLTPLHAASGSGAQGPHPMLGVFNLDSAKSYEFQMRNVGSATDIGAGQGAIFIRSAFRDT